MEEFNNEFIEYIEKELNIKIKNIFELTNGSYNKVYKLETSRGELLLRIFKDKSWPENGKLEFINRKLIENKIECAKILIIERNDKYFKNGFMIQEYISDNDLEDVIGIKISYEDYFKKLAKLLKKIHNIKIKNCGYIGTGIASHDTLISFMEHECYKTKEVLLERDMLSENKIDKYINIILNNLNECSDLPFVLCHNDISENNVMLKGNDIVLIDWDNAISNNWILDFANMTYWLHLRYNREDYERYRNIFINEYSIKYDLNKLFVIEQTYHLFQCLKLLSYYYDESNIAKIRLHLLELDKIL